MEKNAFLIENVHRIDNWQNKNHIMEIIKSPKKNYYILFVCEHCSETLRRLGARDCVNESNGKKVQLQV